MMKSTFLLVLLAIAACNNEPVSVTHTDTVYLHDTVFVRDTIAGKTLKDYSNERFKNVTVEKAAKGRYVVKGRAQVFEAALSWVVEDGHNEVKQGHTMADEGAPAFGNFAFIVEVVPATSGRTLTLVLFEASAKDGSRQHQMVIPLPA